MQPKKPQGVHLVTQPLLTIFAQAFYINWEIDGISHIHVQQGVHISVPAIHFWPYIININDITLLMLTIHTQVWGKSICWKVCS